MEKLLKQKDRIERELLLNKDKYDTILNDEITIKDRINTLKVNKETLTQNYTDIKEKLKQRKVLFIRLKTKIKEYKEHKYKDIRDIYVQKYTKIINNVNNLEWKYNLQIFTSFKSLKEIKAEAGIFKNLSDKIDEHYKFQKGLLKEYLFKEVIQHKEMHNMIYLLKFIAQYEEFFKEMLFTECMNQLISKGYEYHFLCDKETNRLDKAEWLFNFLEKKIKEISKFTEIFNTLIKNEKNINSIDGIFKNIIKLIKLRIKDLEETESKQQRNIMLNFNLYLSLFIKNIKKDYNINLENKFREFRNDLIDQEKRVFYLRLQNIHKMNYKLWFIEYETIIKELLDLNKKYLNINVEYIIDNILEYNLVFIDSMRYINRKEIHLLIYLFNKFEDFKETIHFLFEENVSNEDDERNDEILMKLSKFNLENFKLIKTLFNNDINNVINLKFYFISDLNVIMEDYKKCKGFSKLKKMASEMIDKYLLNILMSKKLEKSEYLDFLNLFKKLKEIFDVKQFESRECMKCIKGFYEKKGVENKFTKEIMPLYE